MKVPFFCALLVAASVSAVPNDLDPIFAPPLNPNAGIMAMACQPDGKIIVAGGWGTVGASGHSRIARLDPVTGAVDESYTTTIGGGGQVKVLRFRRDGKLYVAGSFSSVNGTARGRVARLNADGTLDTTFADPQVAGGFQVYSLVEQSDGKVIIGGSFTTVNGTARTNMARLNEDGSLDTSYNPAPNGAVQSLALLPNNQVLAGGGFYAIAGLANFARFGIAILNSDGTADSTALPLVVHGTFATQPDGKILLSGKFDQMGGTYY